MDYSNETMEPDQYCTPGNSTNVTETCDYVMGTDACDGGGYLTWTIYVYCCEDPIGKWFIVVAGVIFLLFLFLLITTSADDFLCPNVSTIVSKLNISENMAGVTFMAFGNGAPDVFSSIASVVSAPIARADLALGTLLGGTMFVTMLVTSAVVMTRPFKAALFSTLRDLIFFMITIGFILLFFLQSTEVDLWMPLSLIGIYIAYVATVFAFEIYKKRLRRRQAENVAANADGSGNRDDSPPPYTETLPVPAPTPNMGSRQSSVSRIAVRVSSALGPGHDNEIVVERPAGPEEEDNDFIITHSQMRESLRRNRVTKKQIIDRSVSGVKGIISSLLSYFAIEYDSDEPTRFERIKAYILYPATAIFRLTVPLSVRPWSKPMAIVHSIVSPQCFLFTIQVITVTPVEGGPGLYVYVLPLSALLILFVMCTTTMDEEPRFYKLLYSLTGFVMSIGWMYCISSEIVDVITMIGVVTGIDQAILGLTVIAWANSVGDLIADPSVARQGFPRMAMAASIGGPLFNLLMGFGLPFTIAQLKGTTVPIAFNSTSLIMIVFMFIGLLSITAILLLFRANLMRPHGIVLIAIYVAFLLFIILSATNVLIWIQ